jgi:hypothetical protein
MAKPTSDTDVTIEALLEQRTQYEEWLAKLDNSGDKAPPAVRQRVRGDYEARLQNVMEQLRGRGAAIAEELERHHASQAELDRQRRTAEEALAESEVRHAVGEYTEDEWRRISEQSHREIEQLRTQIRGFGGEITLLTDVQTLIAAPRNAPPPPPPAQPAPRPAPRPEIVEEAPLVTHVAEPIVEPEPAPPVLTPRHSPKSHPPQPEPAAAELDELTFLKSVSDEEPRTAPRRPSGQTAAPTMTSAPPRPAEPTVQATPAAAGGKTASGVAKTLKCGECGTLNRPTEWYCERCGAELAGV